MKKSYYCLHVSKCLNYKSISTGNKNEKKNLPINQDENIHFFLGGQS